MRTRTFFAVVVVVLSWATVWVTPALGQVGKEFINPESSGLTAYYWCVAEITGA